jgi:predicted DNA-binding transcriptional regulator YafY
VTDRDHDTLALRLAAMLLKLNQGQALSRQDLADEFGVTERTVYRDLNRLGRAIDRRPDGLYEVAPAYRGKFQTKDLEFLARLAGIDGLFPSDGGRTLPSLLDEGNQCVFLVKGQQYDVTPPAGKMFYELASAVRDRVSCRIAYSGKSRVVYPYRLVNHVGVWYLAAEQDHALRTFSLHRIESVTVLSSPFNPKVQFTDQIQNNDGVWYGDPDIEVTLSVAAGAAHFFRRQRWVPGQEIIEEDTDGSLLILSRVTSSRQIAPIVRYWIPDVHVLEPAWLRDEIAASLVAYSAAPTTG